ncbi:RusA family crossover junction endodeoxyribonuclease, partial [Acinetobacter baumannii]
RDWHTSRPDGDNVLKAVGDGLNAVLWRDDAQIAEASIRKIYSETPGLEIEVHPL